MSSKRSHAKPAAAAMFRALMELLRLPNIFTAAADVAMGVLFVTPLVGAVDTVALALLVGASCLLYASGVVLNDVFDVQQDAQHRPERPIPSGRMPLSLARTLGWLLLLAGVTSA
ncbi:MAG: UbiA family prenyltransferase, partial [Patescibacteria group bacterium]|nr:UbiA family prenyltransferase [Patescibacteria group bacterium]